MKVFKVKNTSGQEFDVNEDKIQDAEKDGYLPVVSNGKETHRVSYSDLGLAVKDGYNPLFSNDISQLESGLRGAAQGATFNLADEITGGLEAIKDVTLTDNKLSDLPNLYTKHRDESREAYKQAEETNPGSFLTGNLIGGVGTALAMPASAATLAGRAAQAAGIGAVMGYGANENRDELLKDMALNAGLGAVSVPVIEGIGSVAKKGLQKASDFVDDKLLPGIGKSVAGVDEKATTNYLQNSKDVNKANSLGELADSVLNQSDDSSVLNEMKKKVIEQSSDDWNTLGRNTSINKNDLLAVGDDFVNKILKGKDGSFTRTQATGADADALKAIYKELDNIQNAYGDSISEADLKSIIQSMQKKAFGSDTYSQEKMQQLSGVFNNILKNGNNNYADSVAKTADTTQALNQIKSVFQNRQNPENYDKFNKTVKNLINKDEMSAANQAVEKIQEHTGYNLRKDIVDSWTKQQFEKGDTNGSRKTMMGALLGKALEAGIGGGIGYGVSGDSTGAAIGAMAGFSLDKYAAPLFKKMLDGRLSIAEFNSTLAPRLGKFAQPFANAINRGPAAVSAIHFLLSQNNPTYRKMIQGQDK